MFILLAGHDCRHAIEQALLSWLPDRERVWGETLPETGDALVSTLLPEADPPRAEAVLRLDGVEARGVYLRRKFQLRIRYILIV